MCDFGFLDKLRSGTPREIATSLTRKHEDIFREVSRDDFPASGRLRDLISEWARLAVDIKACCHADDSLISKIADIEVVRYCLLAST